MRPGYKATFFSLFCLAILLVTSTQPRTALAMTDGTETRSFSPQESVFTTEMNKFYQAPSVNTIMSIDGTSEGHTSDATSDTNADPRPMAVGEVITYRLVVEMPEGTSPDVQVTDTLAPNIEFISGTARASFSANTPMSVSAIAGIKNEINPTTSIPAGLSSFGVTGPRELRFDIGQVVNNDTDNAASTELLIIEYQAVVVNTSDNRLGNIWANDFEVDLDNDGTDDDVSNEVFSVVHEPVLSMDKSINTTLSNPAGTTIFDGGDTVIYDLLVTGGNAANQTTAFDLQVFDGIHSYLDLVDVDFIGTPAYATTSDNSDYALPIQSVNVTISQLDPGDTIIVRVTATVRSSVTKGQVIANTANLTWSSLPGLQGTGNITPGNSGDTNGERNGDTTGENDYNATDNVNFTIGGVWNTIMSIDGTSEGHTSDATSDTNADPRPMAVGEVITYRLVVEMPEGTSPDVQVTDTLAPNIEFIAGTVRISYSANNVMEISSIAGILNEINPTTSIPAGLITFGVYGPRELRFDIGQVVNNDTDNAASTELLIIEYQAVVVNTSDNRLGNIWANDFEVDLDNDGTDEDVSNEVFSIVHEPVVTATKSIVGTTDIDVLDPVTYDITISAGSGATRSTAFDLRLLDNLHEDLELDSVSIQTNPGYVMISTDNSTYGAGGQVDISLNYLEPGDSVVIRITTTVLTTVSPGELISNTARLTWTSLPGLQGTGNITPGNSGDTNGERNGSLSGENDYSTVTNAADFTLYDPIPRKFIAGTSETATSDSEDGSTGNERPIAIGERITYRLVSTLPESTTISLRMEDILAPGLSYVPGSARVSYLAGTLPSFSGDFSGIQNETNPSLAFPPARISFDNGTRVLSFNFGSVINNDGDSNPEKLVIEFDVVVLDDPANHTGVTRSNDYDLLIDEGLPTEVITTSNTVAVEIVEPVLALTQTFTPSTQVRGQTVTLNLVVSNPAADGSTGPVFDLDVTDTLDDWLDVTGINVSFNAAATSFGSTYSDSSVLTPGFASGVSDQIRVALSGLPVDGVATIAVTLQIDPNADPLLLSRILSNTVDVTGDSLASDITPDDQDRAFTDSATFDLYIVKPTLLVTTTDSIDPATAGASMSYTITVQNTGTPNFSATNVILTDQIPTGFDISLVTPSQGTCNPISGSILTCQVGDIASGASANVVVTGSYSAVTASGTIANNIAYVSSMEGNNGNDGNDTPSDGDDERAEEPTTTLRQVGVEIKKAVNDVDPLEGQEVSYTLTVSNHGPSQSTNVIVTDDLPAGITFVEFSPGTLPCVYAAPTLTCTFPVINVNEEKIINILATVNAGTLGSTISNTATVISTEPETDLTDNTADAVITVIADNTPPTMSGIDLTASYSTGPAGFKVTFSEEVENSGNGSATDDVTNRANYLLVEKGMNNIFDTVSCGPVPGSGGLKADDTQIQIDNVTYDPITFTAAVSINGNISLPGGEYRLFICGTTSIVDLAGNPLNGGTDTIVDFSVANTNASLLPKTGFAPNIVTFLPEQPVEKAYADTSLWLEIPVLKINQQIVGVPGPDWDVTWLGNQIGYLYGTAFPTWNGNSVLTAHVTDANGKPGPFANLGNLSYGNQVIIHAWGQDYTYEVRTVDLLTSPYATSLLSKHEKLPWLTLITCRGYDEKTNTYLWRTVVRAVLVNFE